ncbi:hypothetical protein UCD39_25980 [Nitrospirillum sp. BR 11752]|uniref:hypothetical protein n=1 Tax=Nitrospirillum sp. BR 11752 TaxID=3104293 RepID=UPI002EB6283F|nr:hypothetical protein [Nitrospirillum sp. BR 11752]
MVLLSSLRWQRAKPELNDMSTFLGPAHWSNGQTEGQITKLKLVKRQMYGRGKLDLLQARVIGAE